MADTDLLFDDAAYLREAAGYYPPHSGSQRRLADIAARIVAFLKEQEGLGPWGRCNDCAMQIQEEGSLTHCARCVALRDAQHENQELRAFVETVRLKAQAANDSAQVQIALGDSGTDEQMVHAVGAVCKSLGTAMAEIEIAAIDAANKGTPIVTRGDST